MPDIFHPFPYRISPHVAEAREHLTDWTRRIGLIAREASRKRFAKADFGWFAAMVYPTADATQLNLMADWFAWLFLVDDQLDDGSIGRSPERARDIVDGMRAVLESPDHGAAAAADRDGPVAVSALADLWLRTAPHATANWRRRFVQHLDDCLTVAATWEAGNRVTGTVPDEETYIEMRRHTGAIYVCMDLIDIVERIDIPDSLYTGAQFRAALDAACNVVCWTNDVYSLAKERALGEVHNLVHIVEHHRGLDTPGALDHVCAATSTETTLFLEKERELLAARPEHHALLVPSLAGMRTWMRGNLDWSRSTKRYRPVEGDEEIRPEEYLEASLMKVDQ
ncbi:terpene cyclase [Streptomyces platensis]|uniref:terpene synthase family protein n=1 Tax=Streptomyces platensis TaxID=58346 RepID=UPI003865EF7D|nr:terpene cyclase [Streptomyces platensis]